MRISLALIFLAVLLLPDLYNSFVLLRRRRWHYHLICWLPTLTAAACAALWVAGFPSASKVMSYILTCIALPKLAFALLSAIGRIITLAAPKAAKSLDYIAAAAGAATLIIAVFSCSYSRLSIHTQQHEIACQRLPNAYDGYRIVHISDLHLGTFAQHSHFVDRLADSVNALHPDLIVFTGDLVNVHADEALPFLNALAKMHAPDGVHSILGNHDSGKYAHYSNIQDLIRDQQKLQQYQRDCGWDLMIDENRILHRGSDSIALIGVNNIGAPPFPKQGDLNKARHGVNDSTFSILLSHDPSHWKMEVLKLTPIDLMLAGHTHAMQVKIGNFSPARWKYDEWGGLYSQNKQHLFVSIGLGGTFPIRIGAFPTIDLLVLKKSCN